MTERALAVAVLLVMGIVAVFFALYPPPVEPVPCAPTVRTCTRTDVGPVGAPYWIVECVEEGAP